MGKLFDDFGHLKFQNEAAVSQNFVLPLLQGFLGYKLIDIIPEKYFPAKDIYSGVRFSEGGSKGLIHRPDFVICLDGNHDMAKFIIDSKGPDEDIDNHFGQLQSYALSVGKNFIMLTNGKELKVFNVNELVFHSNDIADLQIKLTELHVLLGRNNQNSKTTIEILKDVNIEDAITITDEQRLIENKRKQKVLLADFKNYLDRISRESDKWYLPNQYFQGLENLNLSGITPDNLLTFCEYGQSKIYEKQKLYKIHNLRQDIELKIKVVVGDTGSGKTSMLKYLNWHIAETCLSNKDTRIPIYIALREISNVTKIKDLILSTLNRNGYTISSFYDLPKKNEFILFLDAYDEVPEIYQDETFREIEYLGENYECFITTRPNSIPRFKPSVGFEILPITDEQIKIIVENHIGGQYHNFHYQLERSGMKKESGNILLLLCLISVFKELKSLPKTVTQVISVIVNRIEKWQISKKKQTGNLNWETISKLLSILAYYLIDSDKASLSRSEVESLLVAPLIALENNRKIQIGITTTEILHQIEKTGLLVGGSDSLYFWHRLFLNHFASLGLKDRLDSGHIITLEMVNEKRWQLIIIGVASFIKDCTPLIQQCKFDLWLCSSCLQENGNCNQEEFQMIVDDLMEQVSSDIPEIRVRASYFVTNIESDYVLKEIYTAIENETSAEIKMFGLSRIGKTKSKLALDLILKNIEWTSGSFFSGSSSQAHIARGLYYYHETEHLLIIERWEKTNDLIMNRECGRIFLELQNQGNLTENIIKRLKELFIKSFINSKGNDDKLRQISDVLSSLPDTVFNNKLVDLLFETHHSAFSSPAKNLLKQAASLSTMEKIKTKLFQHIEDKGDITGYLVDIICESKCKVPKELFFELAAHPNKNVAYKAVAALSRFNYGEVKDKIDFYFNSNDPQMQNGAAEALINNGEIIEIFRKNDFPSAIYVPTAYTLIKAIRRFNLSEGIELLDRITVSLKKDFSDSHEYSLAFEVAGAYYFIGEKEKQRKIIKWYYNGKSFTQKNSYIHFHLLKKLKLIEPNLATEIVICFFETYYPFDISAGGIQMDTFLEAVEELENPIFIPRIKKIVEDLCENKIEIQDGGFHFERPMRTLVTLVKPDDEDWVLNLLETFKINNGFTFPQIRRAVECLAFAGSKRSLPIIREYATKYINKEIVVNTCQYAFESICMREKIQLNGDLFTLKL